ncbi:MAG TPA: hypothetical protein VGF46_04185 [Gaiellales bacterium]|jgi:hypothetical protein
MHLLPRACLLSLIALCASALPADAALRIAANASGAKLAVSADGRALVTWTQGGVHRSAVVTGSKARYAGTITPSATAVKVTPTVPFAVAQMQLPNGEQFALQIVHRLSEGATVGPAELYLARWHGDPTDLTLMAGDANRICGTVSYHGKVVNGSAHSSTGNPLDALGRNVYLDSDRPTGWYRLLGVLARPLGYALVIKSDWVGSQYRATIIGPNVDGDLAPVASAVAPATPVGTCPFPPGTYKGE